MDLTPVIPIAGAAWLVAQGSKFVLSKLDGSGGKFSDPGGMPSSHAAVVTSGTTAIGFEAGTGSALFGLAVIVTAVVLHDAYRVRWSVGEQAARLNELSASAKPKLRPLVVWRGHRLREVIAGSLLGIIIAAAVELWVLR